MHSGNFDIPKNASFKKITDILTGKVIQTVSVTIPEGFTITEIAHTLHKKHYSNKSALLSMSQIKQSRCLQICLLSMIFRHPI